MKHIVIYFALWLCHIYEPLYSNNLVDYYKQISIAQGLTQSTGSCILRDHKGILWIGTKNGLNRLAGNEIINYFPDENDSNTLPGNYINLILEDSLNNLWIAADKGLAIHSDHGIFTKISDEIIFSGVEIENGILFSSNHFLYRYSYSDHSFRKITLVLPPDSYSQDNNESFFISGLIALSKDEIIFSTKAGGLYRYNIRLNKTSLITPLAYGNMIMSIYLDGDLLYVSSFKKGVRCFDLRGNLLNEYSVENKKLSNNLVYDIKKWNNRILMATDGDGITVLNPANNETSQINNVMGNNGFISIGSVIKLYIDDYNNLWAGSIRDGVFNLKNVFIHTYNNVSRDNSYGVSEKAIISLFEDSDRILWIGTDGGGINSYNPETDKFTYFETTSNDKVVSITSLTPEELLVSVYGKGLFTFNKRNGTYKPFVFVNDEINHNLFYSGFAPFAHRVSTDKIYILSNFSYVFYPKEKRFEPLISPTGSTFPDGLTLMYSDDEVSYTINATYSNILYQIYQEDDIVRQLYTFPQDEIIIALTVDKSINLMWIATKKGLYRYDIANQELEQVQSNLFKNITHLYMENTNRIWICAQNMLFLYLVDENKQVIWSESDGFVPNEILFMYQEQTTSNNIYLGGNNGFVKIERNIPINPDNNIEINLLDFIYNGSSYLNQIDSESKTYGIPWNYISLAIKINLSDNDFFRKTLFHYTIMGENNKYEIESYENTLNLPSLSPGKYSVFVSCNTNNGELTPLFELITVKIIPPWYKNSLVIYSSVLSFFVLILGVTFYVFKRKDIKLRWKMKEKEQALNENKIQFLINVNHELRTPLTLIYAPLKRIIDQGQIESPAMENSLKNIFNQTKQMLNLINMVLDLSKFETQNEQLNIQPFGLNNWLTAIIQDFTDEFKEKNVILESSFDQKIDTVFFDEAKCKIVVYNLLINALKFSEPDTKVIISTTIHDEFIRISVTDEGTGLKDTDINLLFTRYYQANNKKAGSGIGLSYVKELINRHEGNVGAYNNPHRGATFYFELPVISSVARQQNLLSKSLINDVHQEISGKVNIDITCSEFNVLVVDDIELFQQFLRESLQDCFKTVYTASNGVEALEIIYQKQPDIIVSDVMMPEMDGFELCKAIKTDVSISHIPVILLTARADNNSVDTGYKMGADFYLPKPFDITFLMTIIKNILHNRALVKQRFKQIISIPSEKENTYSYADEKFMQKLNSLIRDHMNNPELDVKFLTLEMGMSRTSLYNKARILTGMGINDYINKFRTERAVWLLINTDMSITDITDEIGYTYQRYFSMMFKRSTGLTPTQYREKHRNK